MTKLSVINSSFMKWTGSKRLMIHKLLRKFPKQGDVLCEPFAGSCTVALNTRYERYYLNDANPDLIRLYQLCQQDPDGLISVLRPYFDGSHNNATAYEDLKARYNLSNSPDERAVLLMVLSRHCYNGLVRYSKKSGFNTPFGDISRPYLPEKEIQFFAEKLRNAVFSCMDFEAFILSMVEVTGNKNKYCDPPYLPLGNKKNVFTQYTKEGFSLSDHARLDQVLTNTRSSFDVVAVSNHYANILPDVYRSMRSKTHFRVTRTISCRGDKRKKASEVLMHY